MSLAYDLALLEIELMLINNHLLDAGERLARRQAPACILPPPPAPEAETVRELVCAALNLLTDGTLHGALMAAALHTGASGEVLLAAQEELLGARNRFNQPRFALADSGPELVDELTDWLGCGDTVPVPAPRDTAEMACWAEVA